MTRQDSVLSWVLLPRRPICGLSPGGSGLWPIGIRMRAAASRKEPSGGGVVLGYLDGKVALVTGASRGIGRAVALKFAAEGAKVAVNYLTSEEEAHQVVQEIESRGGEALAVRADVARKADVVAMVERICEEWGGVDILMNNAGLASTTAERMSEEDWDRVIDVNLKGTFLCTQAVIPSMRAGRVR